MNHQGPMTNDPMCGMKPNYCTALRGVAQGPAEVGNANTEHPTSNTERRSVEDAKRSHHTLSESPPFHGGRYCSVRNEPIFDAWCCTRLHCVASVCTRHRAKRTHRGA